MDVDDNEIVTPLDVLTVIYYINGNGGGELPRPMEPTEVEHRYVDVNGDNNCTPLDVLEQIAHINRQSAGDGEAAVAAGPVLPVEVPGSAGGGAGVSFQLANLQEKASWKLAPRVDSHLPIAQNPPHQVEPRPVQHAPAASCDALLSYELGDEDTSSHLDDLLAIIADGVTGASLDATPFDISISQMVDE